MPNPTQPMNEEELDQIEKDMVASFESFRTTPPETYLSATSAASSMAASLFMNRILHRFRHYRSPEEVDTAIREARIDEAKEIRDNISELGSEVYFAVQRIDGHIKALQSQPNVKELLGMEVKTDDKLSENGIRFDHPDGRSEGFVLSNAKEDSDER